MSVVVFVFYDKVVWLPALVMAVGAIAGGYAGATLATPAREVVRWIVILLGFGLTAYYFARPVA